MRDVILRTALWEVHNHQCAYCGQLVSFPEVQADHIIPAVLKKDQTKRELILGGLGLLLAADLDALWNRLPSHGNCNRKKGDDLLSDNSLRYFLQIAGAAVLKIEAEVNRLEKRLERNRLNAALSIAISAGQVTVAEVIKAAVAAGSGAQLIAHTHTGTAASKLIKDVAAGTDISELLAHPITPRPHGLEHLTMSHADGRRAKVTSCEEWAQHTRDGFYAVTTYDIKEEVFFKETYATLKALELAAPAATSFLRRFRFDVAGANVLSANFLPRLSTDVEDKVKEWASQGISIFELTKSEGVLLEEGDGWLNIGWQGMTAHLREVLRADLDSDGVEDLLYLYYYRADQGTFAFGTMGVLTCRSTSAMLERIAIPALTPKPPQRAQASTRPH